MATHILLALGAISIYLILSVLLMRRLLRPATSVQSRKIPMVLAGFFALALHAVLLHSNLFGSGGLDVSIYTIFSLVAWLVTFLFLLAVLREPIDNLGIAILPIASIALLARLVANEQYSLTTALTRGIEFHILSSVIAYSLLTIAALQAILLYIQDAQLHNKHPGGFVRALPPLETMERLMFRLIAIGFVVLSASLISGVFFVENLFAQHLVHKFVLSISAWILFAVLLWGRFQFGWRGRIAIRWTLSGFLLLLLAYFGSKFVIELILRR